MLLRNEFDIPGNCINFIFSCVYTVEPGLNDYSGLIWDVVYHYGQKTYFVNTLDLRYFSCSVK